MKRFALLIALIPLALFAAPVPKGAEDIRNWGEPVDPRADCKFEVNGGKLTITVPGKARTFVDSKNNAAPRVLQEIEGDFTMEVTVEFEWPAGAVKDRNAISDAGFSAGLIACQDDDDYIELSKWSCENTGKITSDSVFIFHPDSALPRNSGTECKSNPLNPTKPVKFRMKREGKRFTGEFSEDRGKTWSLREYAGIDFAAKLKVGVLACHTTTSEFKPTFSDFKLEKSDPKTKP